MNIMDNLLIYYHIYTVTNWLEIVADQINTIKNSNLLHNSLIKIGVLYDDVSKVDEVKECFKKYENVEFLFLKFNTGFGESETLSMLYDFSIQSEKNINILYLHTKGVTHYGGVSEIPVKKWRNMMEYFLVENWDSCVEKLNEGYDCCGINYQNHSANIKGKTELIKIFNGNFFWTKTDYIKKLDKSILFEHRYSSENWIYSSNPNVFSFYKTPITIDLYHQIDENYK